MDSKHVIGLYEAYLDVYSEREYIPEASRSDVSYAREAVSNARKRYKEHPEGHKGDDTAYQYKLAKGAFKSVVNRARQAKNKVEESVDLYDVVLDHLLDEGYCDDVESAEIIMANMSEEWLDEIVEAFNQKGEFIRDPNSTDSTPFPNPPQQWNPRGRRPAMTYVERRRLAATKTPEQIEQERQRRMKLANQLLNTNNQNNPTS